MAVRRILRIDDHEIDHLNGILFTQRIRDLSTLKYYGKATEAAI